METKEICNICDWRDKKFGPEYDVNGNRIQKTTINLLVICKGCNYGITGGQTRCPKCKKCNCTNY